MADRSVLEKKDSIAYNPIVRQQLENLHDMLGVEITDIPDALITGEPGSIERGQNILKELSKLTSDLSVALLEIKGQKDQLNPQENTNYESIKGLVGTLGNLQYELNDILKFKASGNDDPKLAEMAMDLEQDIISVQEEFRKVRSNINDLGFLSYDPNISFEYNKKD